MAMTKAFLAINGGHGAASARVRELVEQLTQAVVGGLMRNKPAGGTFHIEDIQDQVELALMRSGEHEVARAYVLYREKRSQERAQKHAEQAQAGMDTGLRINVNDAGVLRPLDAVSSTPLLAHDTVIGRVWRLMLIKTPLRIVSPQYPHYNCLTLSVSLSCS